MNGANRTNGSNGRPASARPCLRAVTAGSALQQRDATIITLVRQFRCLTTDQIHRVLGDQFRSRRTLTDHLRKLTLAGHIARFPLAELPRGQSAIYHEIGKRPWSYGFLQHEIAVTQCDLNLQFAIAQRSDLQLLWHERRLFRPETALAADRELIPDSAVLVGIRQQTPLLFLTEVDRESTTPLTRMEKKLRAYADWFASGERVTYTHRLAAELSYEVPQPIVLIVVANRNREQEENRLADLFDLGLRLPYHLRQRLWITDSRALHGPWLLPQWIRVFHAKRRGWLQQYRDFTSRLPAGVQQRKLRQQHIRRFVLPHMLQLPRRCPLPHPSSL